MNENKQTLVCQAASAGGQRCGAAVVPGTSYCQEHQAGGGGSPIVAGGDQVVGGDQVAARTLPGTDMEEEMVSTLAASQNLTSKNGDDPVSDEELRAKIREEIRRLSEQMEANAAADQRPQDAGGGLLKLMRDSLAPLAESEWFSAETWQGIALVAQATVDVQRDFLARRLRGEYEVDPWGYDQEIADYFSLVAGLMYGRYWRTEITGVEHIPNFGRALLVANHSGVLPMDGAMIAYGVAEQHPARRLVRALVANWFPTLPFLSTLLTKTGQVLAHPDNGRRLLEADEVVLVFPEGYKGVSKLFRDRYKLARFGRGGFVKMAVDAQAPILPVAVVGAEETYPMLANVKPLARLLGFPFFPITPTFPLLGPLGFVPLPSKWTIDIGKPIDISQLDPAAIQNPAYVSDLTDMVRNQVQEMVNKRLATRRSAFLG